MADPDWTGINGVVTRNQRPIMAIETRFIDLVSLAY